MSAAIFRPDVEAWRNHDEEQRQLRMDAVAAFEARREQERQERRQVIELVACALAMLLAAVIVRAVLS